MSNKTVCEEYPDIFRKPPPGASTSEVTRIHAQNEEQNRLYQAIRYLLENDFGIRGLPALSRDFPGSLYDDEKARFLAVYGLLCADKYTDPSLGKDKQASDDQVFEADDLLGRRRPVIIARRFADAVVRSVQEYTARAELFKKVFTYLKQEGRSSTPPSHPAI